MRRLWRVVRWWLKCLWAGKVVPRKEKKLFSRSYMRKLYRPELLAIDVFVNEEMRQGRVASARQALGMRRLLVARRRMFFMPQGVE